ncbi:MAG: hypothetical protein WCG94_07765, partial [Methanothrix sp.]
MSRNGPHSFWCAGSKSIKELMIMDWASLEGSKKVRIYISIPRWLKEGRAAKLAKFSLLGSKKKILALQLSFK